MKQETTYPVVEIFRSIQGEGMHMGHPAIFIRFAKCNLRCQFCDTEFDRGEMMDVAQITDALWPMLNGVKYVIFTGGEPLLHQNAMLDVIQWLRSHQADFLKTIRFCVETNGTLAIEQGLHLVDFISVSPKVARTLVKIQRINELKILYPYIDGSSITDWESAGVPMYLQPIHPGTAAGYLGVVNEAMYEIFVMKKKFPRATIALGVQLHKLINVQ